MRERRTNAERKIAGPGVRQPASSRKASAQIVVFRTAQFPGDIGADVMLDMAKPLGETREPLPPELEQTLALRKRASHRGVGSKRYFPASFFSGWVVVEPHSFIGPGGRLRDKKCGAESEMTFESSGDAWPNNQWGRLIIPKAAGEKELRSPSTSQVVLQCVHFPVVTTGSGNGQKYPQNCLAPGDSSRWLP
jgi:hypothetical protein